jgi:toxin-antitoxin system PIN domain toxin
MIVPDLNLIIYAVNAQAAAHPKAREWWEARMNGSERIGLPWVVLLGFLRLTTSPRVFASPLSPAESWELVESWLDWPQTTLVNPGPKHAQILKTLVLEHGTAGNLTTDAHLAALCLEHEAKLHTADNDFSRFRALRWHNPLLSA